ncbi:MAG: translocation/assembly module TamB domain-containing protein [Bdellovibrionales bacterium]
MKNLSLKFLNKVIALLKIKKVFVSLIVLLSIFLLTPISLYPISKKIETFINLRSQTLVENLQKQMGLEIHWEDLSVQILNRNIHLKNVTLMQSPTPSKNTRFNLLNGIQKIKSINIQPSLISLLFKNNIYLSEVEIQEGDLDLKTLFSAPKTSKKSNLTLDLPIKKITITNTNLKLTHQNQHIKLINIQHEFQKKAFHIYDFTTQIKEVHLPQEQPFSLKTKGSLRKNKIQIKKMKLSNKTLNTKINLLAVVFDQKNIRNIRIKSSGKLPFRLVNKARSLFNKKPFPLSSLVSHKLDFQWNKYKNYKGNFHFESSDFIFKNKSYKSFSVQGIFKNKSIRIQEGFISIDSSSLIEIYKTNLSLNSFPMKYKTTLKADNLRLSFLLKDIINIQLPLKADLNGLIQCQGQISLSVDCQIQTKSSQISIMNPEQKLVSFYKLRTDMDLKWSREKFNFTLYANKKTDNSFQVDGNYQPDLKQLTLKTKGFFQLGQNTVFDVFPHLKGLVKIDKGLIRIGKNLFTAEAFIYSQFLQIKNYNFKNISSELLVKDKKIAFNKIKSNPGKSNYQGSYTMDLNKKESLMKAQLSFIDTEDLQKMLPSSMISALKMKGTGKANLTLKIPLKPKSKLSFRLQGDLFNVNIKQEFFKKIEFDMLAERGQKLVKTLSLSKGSGSISASGNFNKNLNLSVTGYNVPLESISFLNAALPFKQSGLLNFNLKVAGPFREPKATGFLNISDSFLYTFPVDNTNLKVTIDKKGLSFSGNLMNEFFVKNLFIPFSKKIINITGNFYNLDFIKILSAKNQKDFLGKYYSRAKGNINLSFHTSQKKISKGSISIENFLLVKDSKWIRNKRKFSIFFSKKGWFIDPVTFVQNDKKSFSIQKKKKKRWFTGDLSLSFLSILLPNFKNLDGDISLNLTTNPNFKTWSPQGTVTINKGSVSLGDLPDFSNIKARLNINNTKIKISQLKTSIGSSGTGLGGGDISYNFKNSPRVNFLLNFSDINLNLPKNFLTKGNGSVGIKGTKPPYLLKGKYLINSGQITKNFSGSKNNLTIYHSLLNEKKSETKSLFDLQFFIQTLKPLSVVSSLLDASIEGNTFISGPLKTPLLTGDFNISKSREDNLILFRDHEFKIISGSVGFKDSSSNNPFINIKAKTLFKEKQLDSIEKTVEKDREYEIFLTVNGFAKNLKFSLESSPFIEEKEIISMLALGMRSKYFDANFKESVTDYSYHLLGSFLLQQSLTKELKNKLGFDLTISPQINVLNEPVTKISLKKIWFDRLKTSFSRTIEEFPESDVRFKYDLKPNISLTTFWENTEHIEIDSSEKQKMGVDFEFALDF